MGEVRVTVHNGRRSWDSLWKLVLFFHHVGCGHQTQAVRLGGKHLSPMSHHAARDICFIMLCIPKKYQVGVCLFRGCLDACYLPNILSWSIYLYEETKVERIAFVQFQQASWLLDLSLNHI